MRTWLRLTWLFGPPDDQAESNNIICDSIGLILRADADDLVRECIPEPFARLLSQIAKTECELLTGGMTASDTAGLLVDIAISIPAPHLGPISPGSIGNPGPLAQPSAIARAAAL